MKTRVKQLITDCLCVLVFLASIVWSTTDKNESSKWRGEYSDETGPEWGKAEDTRETEEVPGEISSRWGGKPGHVGQGDGLISNGGGLGEDGGGYISSEFGGGFGGDGGVYGGEFGAGEDGGGKFGIGEGNRGEYGVGEVNEDSVGASVDVEEGYGAREAGKGNRGEFGVGEDNSGEYGIGGVNGDEIGAIEGVEDDGGFGVGGDNGDGYEVFGDNGDSLGTGGGNGSKYGSAVDNGNRFGVSQDHSSVLGTGGGQERGTGTIRGNGGNETHGGRFGSEGNSDFDEDCCVPFYLCKDGNVITDGSGIIDPRKKPVPSNEPPLLEISKFPKPAYVILLNDLSWDNTNVEEEKTVKSNVRTTKNPIFILFSPLQLEELKEVYTLFWVLQDTRCEIDARLNPKSAFGCGPFHVCCKTPSTVTEKPYVHQCGFRNVNGLNKRILTAHGKGLAEFGEWPWQGAVLKVEGKVNIFLCGAVLIDKFHVLTAAHCVYRYVSENEYRLIVRLGEWDTQIKNEFLSHEDYGVEEIIIHPGYNHERKNLFNDLAVLQLDREIYFGPHIDTICLPFYDDQFIGQDCVVTGWGKNAYKNGSYSNVLREVHVPVIDSYICQEQLRKTRLGRHFELHNGFICAGGEYLQDSCKGDGGGPLMCWRKDGTYGLAGIVSWGIDCGQPGVPGVYLYIQNYLDWIFSVTGYPSHNYWPSH